MNKAFKVLWNDVRKTFVVSSERKMTRGKSAKTTKTIVASAVAGVLALSACSAFAKDITNDSLHDIGTTKFIAGNGDSLNIQTEGDVRKLINAVASKELKKILSALGHDCIRATVVGAAGGNNFADKVTKSAFGVLSSSIGGQLTSIDKEGFSSSGDTQITIGGVSNNPFVVATVGADRVINANPSGSFSLLGQTHQLEGNNEIVIQARTGNSITTMNSGNSLLMTGASSAINIGQFSDLTYSKVIAVKPWLKVTLGAGARPGAKETHVTLDGNSTINLLGSSSSFGTFTGGSAVALGGKASSTLTGNTHLVVNTEVDSAGLEGLTVGALGGGLAVGAFGGEPTSKVEGQTQIDVQKGLTFGVFGGGLAAAGQGDKEKSYLSKFVDRLNASIKSKLDGASLELTDLYAQGGVATASSQNILLTLGKDSSNAFVVGGGFAGAYQYDNAETSSIATTKAGDVHIVVGEAGASSIPNKEQFSRDLSAAFRDVKNFLAKLKANPRPSLEEIAKSVENVGKELIEVFHKNPGVNVGVFGGGMAMSWSRNRVYGDNTATTSPQAVSETANVQIDVLSGYNVGIYGGGLALASGDAAGAVKDEPKAELAKTTVGNVSMNFAGGETIGVMGGGLAIASGTGDMNFGVSANAHVNTVSLNVQGGSVDGLIGGGYALDDTNPNLTTGYQAAKNASSTVDTVNITAYSGTIGRLAFDSFFQNQMPPIYSKNPSFTDYLDSMSHAIIKGKVGIMGGGIASGLRKDSEPEGGAHVGSVNILLAGNTIVGKEGDKANIYGGGLATDGGLSTVDSVNIQIGDNSAEGPVVYGDIYGGGLALDGIYGFVYGENPHYYNNAQSKVKNANIVIAGGTLNGDVYAGGKVLSLEGQQQQASTIVETTHVSLLKDGVFKGKTIDATGVTGDATMTFGAGEFNLTGVTVKGFNKVETAGHVQNLTFDFGEKNFSAFSGIYDMAEIKADKASLLTIKDAGVVALTKTPIENVSFYAADGILAIGDKVTAKAAAEKLSSFKAIPGLYLAGNVDLTNVNAMIGEIPQTARDSGTGVVIGSNGSVLADANADTTLTGGVINGNEGSGLYFTHVAQASKGNKKVVFGENGLNGFDLDNNVTVDNVRYEAHNDKNTFTLGAISDAGKLSDLGLDGFDPAALDLIELQEDAPSKHIQALLDQRNPYVKGGNHRHAQLNAAFNVAAAGGAQTAGIEGVMLGLDQVAKRASLTNTFVDGWTGFAEITGTQIELGGGRSMPETKTKLGGLAAGGEYTFDNWTFGGLLNLGTGNVKGHGHNDGAKNDVDFYGLQAYAAKRIDMFNIVGQAGWMMSKNDVKHYMGDSAKMDVNVFTIGARGEMGLALNENISVIPYIGMNYLRVHTESYTTKRGFKVDKVNQNLGNVPVGVAVKGNIDAANGWKFKPTADIAYVGTFGDTSAKTHTKVGAAKMSTDLDVWTKNVGRARVGLEVAKDNLSVGLTFGGARGSEKYKEVYGQVSVKYAF